MYSSLDSWLCGCIALHLRKAMATVILFCQSATRATYSSMYSKPVWATLIMYEKNVFERRDQIIIKKVKGLKIHFPGIQIWREKRFDNDRVKASASCRIRFLNVCLWGKRSENLFIILCYISNNLTSNQMQWVSLFHYLWHKYNLFWALSARYVARGKKGSLV